MKTFTPSHSIVRRIWGKSDTVLFIFAGAAAEFALNKAVDWLYFTGKLPSDPIGRLFSTVSYAKAIVYATEEEAHATIDKIRMIHGAVEKNRNAQIPDWAYRDVLYMLIHYSIAAFELLERPLTTVEKEDVYDVFYRMGMRMELKDLPTTYSAWLKDRERHLHQDLVYGNYTADLFVQYKKHLGENRYRILIEAQKLVVPAHVATLLRFSTTHWLAPSVPLYKLSRLVKLDHLIKWMLLPHKYQTQIKALDLAP
jgi:hypothetical protein